MQTAAANSEWFSIRLGVKQVLSTCTQNLLRQAVGGFDKVERAGIYIGGQFLTHLRYAHDISLFAAIIYAIQQMLVSIKTVSEEYGLLLNVAKMKFTYTEMINKRSMEVDITISCQGIDAVDGFNYLGSYISMQGGCFKQIRRQLRMTHSTIASLTKVWIKLTILKATKI